MADFGQLKEQYQSELLESVIPFWEKHSLDHEFGGYFSCLDETGKVFDTDKFMWPQCRQIWTFSKLYNQVEKRDSWLEIARLGAEFVRKHAMNDRGDFYFSLDRQGRPLIQAYNLFSDCFAAMAFGQYARASGDPQYADLAKQTHRNIIGRKSNPKGVYEKSTAIRPTISFALPMILSNIALELEDVLAPEEVNQAVNQAAGEVMDIFLDPVSGLIYEHVAPDGTHLDTFEGRLINPGHGMEAMWFMMDIGQRNGDTELIDKAARTCLNILEFGWDTKHGGIFYFMDARNKPPQHLEWDQKLWWVHMESMIACAKGYALTQNEELLSWYQRLHEYTWEKFPDRINGEWYGYLNRRGEKLLTLKGGKWKGCFHVPRGLLKCWQIFEKLGQN